MARHKVLGGRRKEEGLTQKGRCRDKSWRIPGVQACPMGSCRRVLERAPKAGGGEMECQILDRAGLGRSNR